MVARTVALTPSISPKSANATVTVSHVRRASNGLRHSALQIRGRYFSSLFSFPVIARVLHGVATPSEGRVLSDGKISEGQGIRAARFAIGLPFFATACRQLRL